MMDDRGVADAFYTILSVGIVMLMAIVIGGVVLSATMKQGSDASAQIYQENGMRKGAYAFYYNMEPGSDFASGDSNAIILKSPAGEKIDASIAFSQTKAPASSPRIDGCIIWSGYLYVPADGGYIFQLASSDGSWLWIDGVQAIDDHGLHGLQTVRSSSQQLKKGYHTVKVRYFYRDLAAASCALAWDSGNPASPMAPVTLYR